MMKKKGTSEKIDFKDSVFLFIDSSIIGVSVSFCSVSAEKSDLLWQGQCYNVGMSAKEQSVLVLQGLKHIQKEKTDVRNIVVSMGPGSFTGIRVGLSFVYGLVSHCVNPKILGLSSLGCSAKTFFRNISDSTSLTKSLALFLPATKTAGYLAVAKKSGTTDVHYTLNPVTIPELFDAPFTTSFGDANTHCLTAPWPELQVEFAKRNYPLHVKSLLEIAENGMSGMIWDSKDYWPDQFTNKLPEPLFLRKSTVEEKLDQSQGR